MKHKHHRSNIRRAIINALNVNGEIVGTFDLAIGIHSCTSVHHVMEQIRALDNDGIITIKRSSGGRGNKTIYRLNRRGGNE